MPPAVASIACVVGIIGLFWLDREPKVRTSRALWLAVLWLGFASSRSPAQWLGMGNGEYSVAEVMEGNPTDRPLQAAMVMIGLIVLFRRRQQVARLLRENGPIILFIGYCAASILWSDYSDIAFKRWIKVVGDYVMVLIVLSDPEPLAALKRFLARPAYVLIPLSVLFIKYYPRLGVSWGPWGGHAVYQGVTVGKNDLGAICLVFGLGALWRFLLAWKEPKSRGRTRILIAQAVMLAMVVWLFHVAHAMAALSCFLMASFLLLVMNFRGVTKRPAVVHFLIASMLAVSASVLFVGLDPEALKEMGKDPTLTGRTELWGWLFRLTPNSLLGAGFESFWIGPRMQKLWTIYWWHPNEAHNGYIEIFINLGWIGIVLLAVVLATGYRTVIAAYRRNLPGANLRVAYFLVGMAQSFTEAEFFKMLHPVSMFLLLAITKNPGDLLSKEPPVQELIQHSDTDGNDLTAETGRIEVISAYSL